MAVCVSPLVVCNLSGAGRAKLPYYESYILLRAGYPQFEPFSYNRSITLLLTRP